MIKKAINKLYFYLLICFYLLSIIVIFYLLIESVTYSGFILKHSTINISPIQNFTISIGILVVMLKPIIKTSNVSLAIFRNIFRFNLLLSCLFLGFATIMYLLDRYIYINFVFSTFHIQPRLFRAVASATILPLLLGLVFELSNKGDIFKNVILKAKAVFAKFNLKITFMTINNVKLFVLSIYTILFVGYIFYRSTVFVNKFYEVDTAYRQENELKYFSGEMDIYGWVKEYLPKTNDVILWCNKQSTPIKLVTFDPEIIWMSYDALSRVFLTNCFYANIDPVSKSYDYFDDDELLLVSVSRCDPLLINTHPDPKSEIIKYFKIVNNDYICKSKEIVPNLYLYKK